MFVLEFRSSLKISKLFSKKGFLSKNISPILETFESIVVESLSAKSSQYIYIYVCQCRLTFSDGFFQLFLCESEDFYLMINER